MTKQDAVPAPVALTSAEPAAAWLAGLAAPDDFPGALLVTTLAERFVVYGNRAFYQLCQRPPAPDLRIGDLLTPAAKIMVESFLMPMLLHQGHCEEIQLQLQLPAASTEAAPERLPVLVNARLADAAHSGQAEPLIYWVMTAARQRDQLYQELVNLRNDLEQKAERLELLSQTDDLTGLLNRRAFVSRAKTLLKQAGRSRQPCSFLLIDIDHFKQINDQHGHDVGDTVLVEVGRLLAQNSRENDVLARLGGEEFAIVSLDPDTQSAPRFAAKLQQLFAATPLCGIALTVSIGVASAGSGNSAEQATDNTAGNTADNTADNGDHPQPDAGLSVGALSFAALYKAADERLYQAKRQGRNQVVSGWL